MSDVMNIVVGITGASGAIYAERLLVHLVELGAHSHLVISEQGRIVVREELGIDLTGQSTAAMQLIWQQHLACDAGQLTCHGWGDLAASIASGSFPVDGMVVVPCSMSTLAALATGLAANLITRAAAVTLKERRPLVVVPRETPLNAIHLKNMLALHEAGAIMLPAMPAYYQQPRTLEDLADFMAGRVLDALHIPHDVYPRWSGLDTDLPAG